jgi:hypothetical protein
MPPLASNTYSLFTFNSAGAGAIFYSGVRFDPYPIWTTGTYSAAGYVSTQLLVTGYGSGSISFSVASGNTLPSGLSLAANGLLSGTTTANTYNFYVNATDSENEITTQQISLTVIFPDTYFPYTTLLLSASSQTANNVSTETFVDSSDYNNTLTVAAGTPYQGSFSPSPSTETWSNYFNGSTDYLTTSSNSNLSLGVSNFTIEFWLYPSNTSSAYRVLVASENYSSTTGGWSLYQNGTSIEFWISPGASVTLNASSAITSSTWQHLALCRASGTLRLFINGTSVASVSNSTSLTGQQIWIADNNAGSYFYNGYISNFRMINGTALYTSSFTPSTTPLTAIANTSLLTCQSNRFIDANTTPNTITTTGTPKIQRFNPFGSNLISYSALINGGSIYFAGDAYMTIPDSTALRLNGVECTIEMWYYPTQLTAYNVLIAKRGAGGDSYQVFTDVTTGYLAFYNGATAAYSSTAPKLNAWNHIAFVHDGSTTLTMYLNGVSVHTATIQIPLGTSILNIGTDGGGNYLTGYLSNLRILKGTRLYTSTFTPPANPLTAITNTSLLLLGSNSKYYDSTKINNIRNVGGVATRTDIKNYGTNSWYFNGSSYLTMLNNPIFNFPKDFTIELWLYNVTTTFYGNIFSTTANYVTANGIRLTTGPSNNTFSVGIGNSGSVTGNTTFSNNTWVHVALVRSGTSLTIYQNGINIGTGTESTAFISDTMVIGTVGAVGGAGGPYNLNAYIQDFRVTNGIARYTTTFTPPTGPVPTT